MGFARNGVNLGGSLDAGGSGSGGGGGGGGGMHTINTLQDGSAKAALPYILVGAATLSLVALLLVASMGARCLTLWKNYRRRYAEDDPEAPNKRAAIRISHSLPDLSQEVARKEYVQDCKDAKMVSRQTTLPTVPTRHQSFQRQLSHRLDFSNIEFSVCSLEHSRKDSSNIGIIKPELYKGELLRQSSTDSSGNGDMEYAGKLHFTLRYDQDVEGLVVKVLQAKDLPVKDIMGSSDPYVKIYLLPDRKKRFVTKVHRRNLNPVFNETFVISVPYENLRDRHLQFSVYDFDRFSRHDLIGQVVLKGLLDSTDLQKEMEYIMDVLSPPKEKVDLGELMLSLCYLPTAGRLTVTVIKARNLRAMDITGASDPYVKVYLMCQGKRIKKKKTTVKKATLSPVYNEALVFDVPIQNIEDVSIIIKVIDYDRVGTNELLGCVAIGPCFIGGGRDHWLEMLDNPRKPVAQWYALLEAVPGQLETSPNRPLPVPLSCLNGR